eukprot:NODE_1456_length_445_cov_0.720126_g1446_i0.p3 GENE.NODE_1456_length_445_cov_0.720126_g1446_i0~~NODE_1456_length_445_cov_0.720126_g1446_i0.p3  ORF type:complete len:54 (+),score=1.56 NODE_1456_length_445_cov_0.720126_g1446_i0:153-314(+)
MAESNALECPVDTPTISKPTPEALPWESLGFCSESLPKIPEASSSPPLCQVLV